VAQRLGTRRRIYDAALTIFRRDGVVESRTEDIATLAGVSRGAFYFHFPTKEQVLLERMRETESVICQHIDALPEDASIDRVLQAVNRALAAIWEPDPKLLPEIVAVGLRFAALTMQDQQATPLRWSLSKRFQQAAARDELGARLPPEILGDVYLGNTLGGLLAWYGSPVLPLLGVLDAVTDLFWSGARAPSTMRAPAVERPKNAPPKRARRAKTPRR
jgi:AcrR family transcriptional regulator